MGGTRAEIAELARGLFDGGRLLEQDGLRSQAAGHVAGALSYCDDYRTAAAMLEALGARARREGFVTMHAVSLQLLARQRLWTGPLAHALEDSGAAVEVFGSGLHMYLPARATAWPAL